MGATFDRQAIHFEEAQVNFIDQGCRLQGMVGAFVAQKAGGGVPEFFLAGDKKLIQIFWVDVSRIQ